MRVRSSILNSLHQDFFLTNDHSFENSGSKNFDSNFNIKLLTKNIYQTHQKLNDLIENIEENVKKTMDKQENEFFFAYRAHMSRVQTDLKQLSKQIEEQEALNQGNEKITKLQKELEFFKKEAEILSNKLSEKTKELRKTKEKSLISQSEKLFLENKLIEILKKKKSNHNSSVTKSSNNEPSINKTQNPNKRDNNTINIIKNKILERNKDIGYFIQKYNISNETEFSEDFNEALKNKEKEVSKIIEKLNNKIDQMRKANVFLNYEMNKNTINNQEMRSYLENCFNSVKNEIKKRKTIGAHSKDDVSFEDFRISDKMKLIAFVLSNDSLVESLLEKCNFIETDHNVSKNENIDNICKTDKIDDKFNNGQKTNEIDEKFLNNDLPSFINTNNESKLVKKENSYNERDETPETAAYSRIKNSRIKLKNFFINQGENYQKIKTLTDRQNKSFDFKAMKSKRPKIYNFKVKQEKSFVI